MYAKIKDDQLLKFPYTWDDLRKENPNIEFNFLVESLETMHEQTDEYSTGVRVVKVETEELPNVDNEVFYATASTLPSFDGNTWVLKYEIIERTPAEALEYKTMMSACVGCAVL